jgi:hypothetical protein
MPAVVRPPDVANTPALYMCCYALQQRWTATFEPARPAYHVAASSMRNRSLICVHGLCPASLCNILLPPSCCFHPVQSHETYANRVAMPSRCSFHATRPVRSAHAGKDVVERPVPPLLTTLRSNIQGSFWLYFSPSHLLRANQRLTTELTVVFKPLATAGAVLFVAATAEDPGRHVVVVMM